MSGVVSIKCKLNRWVNRSLIVSSKLTNSMSCRIDILMKLNSAKNRRVI